MMGEQLVKKGAHHAKNITRKIFSKNLALKIQELHYTYAKTVKLLLLHVRKREKILLDEGGVFFLRRCFIGSIFHNKEILQRGCARAGSRLES